MTVAMTEDVTSTLPDIQDVPLTTGVAIDKSEYAKIMRSIVDKSVTPVSAFNSSI